MTEFLDSPNPRQAPARPPIHPSVFLLLFAALIALARLHTYDEPCDRDQGDYATIAHEMHFGKRLYTDLPDQKPPAIHLTYYLAESIAGYGRAEIYLLTVSGAVAVLIATYFACLGFFGSREAALWAAAFWSVISGHVRLEANQPNAELFMNAFLMIGLAFLAARYRESDRNRTIRNLLAIGVCFGWATLYKQVLVVTPALIGLVYCIAPPPGIRRLRAFCEMLAVGCVIIMAWLLMAAWLAAHGQLQACYDYLVSYNRSYAGNLGHNLIGALAHVFHPALTATIPLAVLAILGCALNARARNWFPVLLLLGLGIGTQIAVALPGRSYAHYFQLWFPWLILGSSAGLVALGEAFALRWPRAKTMHLAGAALLTILICTEAPNYAKSADEWSNIKYQPANDFVTAGALARVINRLLAPNETFYQIGAETELFPMTGRRPPSSVTSLGYIDDAPSFANRLRSRMLAELTQASPDLMVVTFRYGLRLGDEPLINDYINANYTALPGGKLPTFTLMARNGSNLQKRVEAAGGVFPGQGSP